MSLAYLPHYEWAVLLGMLSIFWSFKWVAPRFGSFPAALFGYLCINSLWVWVWVENRYVTLEPYSQMALRYFSADSLARMLLATVPLMLFSENKAEFSKLGLILTRAFIALNSLWVIAGHLMQACHEKTDCGGFGNPSIMVGLSVCALPLAIKDWKRDWWPLLLAVVAVVLSQSSIALGLLGIYLFYFLCSINFKFVWLGALAIPATILAGLLFMPSRELFNSSDRFYIWRFMMPKWAAIWNIPFGTGWGTYHVFSINLQHAVKSNNVEAGPFWWDTLHNDWLQMVFECGAAGIVLMIGTYLKALWRMLFNYEYPVAMAILLYGIYLCVNPGLHHAIPALFGAWLFIYALKRERLWLVK